MASGTINYLVNGMSFYFYHPKIHSCKHIWSKEGVEKEAKGGKDELSKKTK